MTTLFTNGNLVDVIGQTVLTGGSILVENGMIKEVGTSIAAPDGAKVVDLGGMINGMGAGIKSEAKRS